MYMKSKGRISYFRQYEEHQLFKIVRHRCNIFIIKSDMKIIVACISTSNVTVYIVIKCG